MSSGSFIRDRRWVWSFLAVFALVLATDYLFLHLLFPHGPRVKVLPAVASADASTNDVIPGSPAEAALTDTFAETLRGCFDEKASDVGPSSLLERLESGGLQSRRVESEEWHINRPNGREEHVVLAATDRAGATGKMEARLFSVDDEEARVRKALDETKAVDPSSDFVTSLVTPGDVFFHERKELLNFADGTSAQAAWVNDRLHDLDVTRAGRTLSCRERHCECHSPAAL